MNADLNELAVAWPDTNDWHERRRQGIGASEMAAVVGLSRWATPLDVYLRKTGELEDKADNLAIRVGRRLEPIVIGEFCEETGEEIAMYPCPMVANPAYPFMLATPDADLVSGRLCEAKTANLRTLSDWGPAGTDEVPDPYVIQCQTQLAVAGRDECKLAVLIAGDELRIYTIERNDRLIESLAEAAAEFWQRVIDRRPPDPDFSHPRTPDLVKSLYGTIADDQVVRLSQEAVDAWREQVEVGKQISELEKRRESLKAIALAEIGVHAGGDLGDGQFLKRSVVNVKEQVRKAYSYISVRTCKTKG